MTAQPQVPAVPAPADPPPDWQRAITDMTRFTREGPSGIGAQIPGEKLAELGAVLAAAGMEKQAVVAFLHMWQSMAIQFVTSSMPEIISKLNDLNGARLMRLVQEIRALPVIQLAQTLPNWRERMNGIQPVTVGYVDQQAVLRLIFGALDRPISGS
jgi:hypothetical protein